MAYLDNNRKTTLSNDVRRSMARMTDADKGKDPGVVRENARAEIARAIKGSNPSEIVLFQNENTQDLASLWAALLERRSPSKILISEALSDLMTRSFFDVAALHNVQIDRVGLDKFGGIDQVAFDTLLNRDVSMVSVPAANPETGTIIPLADVIRLIRTRTDAFIHIDAGAAAGWGRLNTEGADVVSISADALHGPEGIGALYIRDSIGSSLTCKPGSDIDTAKIEGFGTAVAALGDLSYLEKAERMRDRLEKELLSIDNTARNGFGERLPNTTNISFVGVNGEAIISRLNDHDIIASTGCACAATGHTPSRILEAMDVPYTQAMGSIRFSLSRYTTDEEIDKVIEVIPAIISGLRRMADAI